jgi:hypothetical protein
MVNPHWDEEINEDITITDLPPWSPQQEWGDVGGGGEFTGWRSAEDPPSYRSDWQDYPADEFTGIQSNVPSGGSWFKKLYEMYGGGRPDLGGGFETPYDHRQWQQDQDLLQKRKYDKYLEFMNQDLNRFNPEPGPWNEFNPRSRYGNVIEPNWGEDLIAELSDKQGNWMDSPIGSPDFYSNFDDYFDAVTLQEDKGGILPWWLGGRSPQEPATQQEVLDKLNQMMKEKNQRLPWPVV